MASRGKDDDIQFNCKWRHFRDFIIAAIFLNWSGFVFQMKVVAGNKTNTTVFVFLNRIIFH